MNTSRAAHQSQISRDVSSEQQPQKLEHQMFVQPPFIETLVTQGRAKGECRDGTHWPPQSLERIAVGP